MKYIAYGSNMSQEQMAIRCPNAKLIGTGYLPNHTLEFYLHATVKPSDSDRDRVPVAVWEIDEIDELNLDYYEGYPNYYSKATRKVQMMDGSEIEGTIYIMNNGENYRPFRIYYDGILAAYLVLGFKQEINTVLDPALVRSIQRESY